MRAAFSLCLTAVIFAVIAGGCGRELYERRLDESKRYFSYLDKLNQNLAPPWVGNGLKLRVPKQFQVIPPPKPKAKKEPKNAKNAPKDAPPEEPAVPERDPRQPTYADLTFPGLQAAFKTQLSVGAKSSEPGYLYVLTNNDLLGRKGSDEKAAQFNNSVIHTIAQAVGQADPGPEKLANKPIPGPKDEAWVPHRTFKMVRPGFAASLYGKDYRIEVYNCRQEKNQVSLVYVLPENVSPAERLASNIDLSLETLQLTKVAASGGGAKGPASRGL